MATESMTQIKKAFATLGVLAMILATSNGCGDGGSEDVEESLMD